MKVFRRDRKPSQTTLSRSKTEVQASPPPQNPLNTAPSSPPTPSAASRLRHLNTSPATYTSPTPRLPVAPQQTHPDVHVRTEALQPVQTVSQIRVPTPTKPGSLFRLAQLPLTQPISLVSLLPQGPTKLLHAADAARADVVNTLSSLRDTHTLVHVIDAYKPYAIAVARISATLRMQGHAAAARAPWNSGLIHSQHASSVFQVSLEAESAFICVLSGTTAIRQVLETPCQLGMDNEVQIVDQIKSLQKAAGLLKYVEERVAPTGLGQHPGTPPPEIVPVVANMLSTLAIAIAQILHVRRAIASNMSPATVAKLAVAAREHVNRYVETMAKCRTERVLLSTDFDQVAAELKYLASAWAYLYSAVGFETPAPRIAALEHAKELLEKGSHGGVVAQAAKESLETLQNQVDDARNENRVVHRESVPNVSELTLPLGRSLVSVTPFQPISVPEDDEEYKARLG